jgi:hypothetical protein
MLIPGLTVLGSRGVSSSITRFEFDGLSAPHRFPMKVPDSSAPAPAKASHPACFLSAPLPDGLAQIPCGRERTFPLCHVRCSSGPRERKLESTPTPVPAGSTCARVLPPCLRFSLSRLAADADRPLRKSWAPPRLAPGGGNSSANGVLPLYTFTVSTNATQVWPRGNCD